MEHLDKNGLISDFKEGFVGGRRLQKNLFIVRYCIEEMYRKEREFVEVAIDIEKAFDSVEIVALVKALQFYKCEPKMIDVIVDL